ncbi:MAG: hypothetical protein QM627_12825 [Luteolibacter sp.]
MKPFHLFSPRRFVRWAFPVFALSIFSLISLAENSGTSSQENIRIDDSTIPLHSDEVRIVGELSDGTPSLPAEPKPRLVFQPDDVVSSRTKEVGERLVTFQKVEPIELPALPRPPAHIPTAEGMEILEQVEETAVKRQFVLLGATVDASNPSKPRSYIQIWPNRPNARPLGIWINANFLWLTGFAEVEAGDTIYSLLMSISTDHVAKTARSEIPEFDDSQASFFVTEGYPQEEDLAPIRALVTLYNKDKDRLRLAYEGRMEAEAERARELRKNPPARKNLVVRYWRLDEAGQAGETPKPANVR